MTFLWQKLWVSIALTLALIQSVLAAVIPFKIETHSQIRVRLAEGSSVALVSGYDLRFYQAKGSAQAPNTLSFSRQSEWQIRCQDGRIRAQRMDAQVGAASSSIGGMPSRSSFVDLREPVRVRSPSGFLNFAGKPYREELQIHSVGSLCEVVNEVDLEKYLEGLVNAEFSSKWNEESVGAQVVAARTYALYQVRQARIQDLSYDVDASTRDQVYDGSIREDANAS